MNESFEQTINRIINDTALINKVEEATRQGVVLPILAQLGWNTYDINEVEPEYKVSDGRVDYCLKAKNKKVFIEVKRMREDLDSHEKQLLEYSFSEGVEIAVLTNGLLWLFYLPTEKGHWQQRKFFAVDLKQQDIDTIITHFGDYLSRKGIDDGSCVRNAKSIKASKEKEKLVTATIPQAWNKLLSEPDELLAEIFADKVESMCGYKPDADVIADFIREQAKPLEKPMPQEYRIPKSKPTVHGSKPNKKPRAKFETIRIKIESNLFEGSSVSDLYDKVLQYLYSSGNLERMKHIIPFETSSKRYLIAMEPYHQRGNEFRVPVEHKGFYMEAHKDRRNALNHLESFLKAGGLDSLVLQD